MDEVDGLSGSDRGGGNELIQMIKKTQIPIVCICNDRQSTKVKSLRNHCMELKYNKPNFGEVANRIRMIARAEKFELKDSDAERIVKTSNCDMRLAVNLLHTWFSGSGANASIPRNNLSASKDTQMGPFDAARNLFSGQMELSLEDRMGLYFLDYQLVPLFIQENYLSTTPDSARIGGGGDPRKQLACTLESMSKAADSFSDSDLVEEAVRHSQAWFLLPAHAVISTLRPAQFMRGHASQINFPQYVPLL